MNMLPEYDPFMVLRAAAVEAGMSLREAGEAIKKAFEALLASDVENAIAEIDEDLKTLATAREWHLMKNAKKYRTRHKYRNRLIKRYYNDTQTERRDKA